MPRRECDEVRPTLARVTSEWEQLPLNRAGKQLVSKQDKVGKATGIESEHGCNGCILLSNLDEEEGKSSKSHEGFSFFFLLRERQTQRGRISTGTCLMWLGLPPHPSVCLTSGTNIVWQGAAALFFVELLPC